MDENAAGIYELPVELGALKDVPPDTWETHARGKNFACTWLSLDPSQPGGVRRTFWDKAKGDYFYHVPSDLQPGAVLEFAADYTTSTGRRSPNRRHFVVVATSDEALVLQKVTAVEAKDMLRAEARTARELSEDEQRLADELAALDPRRRSEVIRAAIGR